MGKLREAQFCPALHAACSLSASVNMNGSRSSGRRNRRRLGACVTLLWLVASFAFGIERACQCVRPMSCCVSGVAPSTMRGQAPAGSCHKAVRSTQGRGCGDHKGCGGCQCTAKLQAAPVPASSVFFPPSSEDLLPNLVPPALASGDTPTVALKPLGGPTHPPDCVWTPESRLGPAFRSHAPPVA
jgi:hypothetical protein